jgi:NitT/TauT family transport system permease protein
MKRSLKRILPIFIVLVIWAICSRFTNPLFLPRPEKVLKSFITFIKNGMLVKALFASFSRITIATFCSGAISLIIGTIIVSSKLLDDMITPVTDFMRFMPVTAFYPLLIMWFGIGETMKITFLFMATFFYFLPTTIIGLKDVNKDLIDTGYTIGMSRFQVLFKIILPAALPNILESFLMMYGIGWTYVVIAEITNAKAGLGHIINVGSARGRTDLVFMSMIVILSFSYIFDTLGKNIIKKSFKWKYDQK